MAMPVQRTVATRALSAAPVTRTAGTATTTRRHNSVSRTTPRGSNSTPDLDGFDFQDVPGLGFDFPHLAAVSGDRRQPGGHLGAFSSGFGGFLLGSPQVIVEEVQPAETQAVPAEEDYEGENATLNVSAQRRASTRRSVLPHPTIEQSAAETASSSDTDPAEYVFVRRDGGLVFAVAYSWENQTLRYVTRDGMRRIMTLDAIDVPATQQFNEQRGLNFRSPA
jgi:hypothetical protein